MTSNKPVRPEDRARHLKVQQTLKMARSAHAYVRGSTVQFYQWLEAQKRGSLPEGPAVWICGDCRAGNLGPVAAVDGHVAVQIRDLDQAVIGNPAHDTVVFSPDGHTALSGSVDETVKLWDVATGNAIQGHSDEVDSVAFAPDGRAALSGSHDKTLKLSRLN